MENNWDLIEQNELSNKSLGGSELQLRRIYDGKIPRDLLEQFQIIPTRVRDLQDDKYRIYLVNDLSQDPEVQKAVADGGHERFHKVVCVSNWQAQQIIGQWQVPWSKVVVLLNAIDPIPHDENITDQIKLIYHTTPHRGLAILLPVFAELAKKYDNLHLDVYSSFKIYGWEQRDESFRELFDFADKHPQITNHGVVSNEEVRKAVAQADIFAYPSIWEETSCLALMEAMSGKCVCVHPNYGALYETAANWTSMYNWTEDANDHASLFYAMLDNTIQTFKTESVKQRVFAQKIYADSFYNWSIRAKQWEALMQTIVNSGVEKKLPEAPSFQYNW